MDKNSYWLDMKNIMTVIDGKTIFNDLSLKLKLTDNTVILGPNGAGKSSIIKLITRNLYPIVRKDSHIRLFGESNINLWSLRKKIGIVSNDLLERFNPNMQAQEVICSGLFGKYYMNQKSNINNIYRSKIQKLIEYFQIEDIINLKISELSEGQKKILLIARSIINEPRVLILDEPTNNLDIKFKFKFLDILREITRTGTTILHITHNVDTIIPEINRVILMKNSKIINDDLPKRVLTSENISCLFDTKAKLANKYSFWQLIPA